jgi:N-methylhydantoinase A/oxoprolinase/acetone carboxylase beta subunit
VKTYCIACGVFRKDLQEILPALAETPEVEYLEGGLHAEPNLLRKELQNAIDKVPDSFERIILLYGVCGKGIVGLHSPKQTIVVPRVHDCISLFLGGTKEYRKQFSHKPGTYYISAGWFEEQVQPRGKRLKNKKAMALPSAYADTLDEDVISERFGKDNSKAVAEFFDAWKKNYSRAVYIDTGSGDKAKYSDYAKRMAEENGWEYTRLEGSQNLIYQCFATVRNKDLSSEEILVVPPGREITFDSATGLVNFASPLDKDKDVGIRNLVFESDKTDKESQPVRTASMGLGIDAGGTYTDAVLFDFKEQKIISRAKSLTTKWKYSEGIMAAVRQLPSHRLKEVDLVSLSTTLVTNAIVESNIDPVGLFLMPMATMTPDNISHSPHSIIKGRMTIEGLISEDIKPGEIKEAAAKMIQQDGVRAFAVSGYGASINPALELKVKKILREETGLDVCCGHELSGTLNFYVRAHTAVLNAGVIPIMEEFLSEMKTALREVEVDAPQLVVKGDGSVMTGAFASEFPVQTALSGPAASMAGARFLTGLDEALVIDVGGTTSDIGYLEKGEVSVCESGASIGSWRTHVKAVDMLTTGLGGDSAIVFDRQIWSIGPGRITPFCWLNAQYDLKSSMNKANEIEIEGESSIPLQWFYKTKKQPDFKLTGQEQKIMDMLEEGPRLISELSMKLCHGVWKLLKTQRLEKAYCIQKSGLTPTDLYHMQGKLSLWPVEGIQEYYDLYLKLQKESAYKVMDMLMNSISRLLAQSVLQRIFPEASETPDVYAPVLDRGNERLTLTPTLKTPVIGLGAPAFLFLEDAVKLLGGDVQIPENGDVANALGAITSKVSVESVAGIVPTVEGYYRILGMEGFEDLETLDEAEELCLKTLLEKTRDMAKRAGSSEETVRVRIEDKTAESAGGDILFLERVFRTSLKGAPDLI